MNQSKIDSVLESLTNIAIGAGVALLTQIVWFGVLGKSFSWYEHLGTTAVFTIVSFIRSYCIRRAFNGKSVYKTIKEVIMKKTIINVLAWVGVGVIAGLLYWIGHFYGYSASADYFHEKCEEVYIFQFEGDETPYLCTPPPSFYYDHHMEFPTTTTMELNSDYI